MLLAVLHVDRFALLLMLLTVAAASVLAAADAARHNAPALRERHRQGRH